MNLEKILSISGKPGLYLLKVQTRTGFVAESLLDGKKVTVGLRSNVSLLSEISIYTNSAEKPLTEVMRNIAVKEDNGPTAISHKEDNGKLITYFQEILPDYDADRVYTSDIKKVLNWYNMLQSNGLVSKEEPKTEATDNDKEKQVEETVSNATEEEVVAEKPKATAKKTKTKKE